MIPPPQPTTHDYPWSSDFPRSCGVNAAHLHEKLNVRCAAFRPQEFQTRQGRTTPGDRRIRWWHRLAIACVLLVHAPGVWAAPWQRHTIDNSSRGADGVRLADANGDGRLDVVTGWEEGGVIRAYFNTGPSRSKSAWPSVTVGKVRSPEDAVFVDLDADGQMDVISSCEGKTKTMFVHWAGTREQYTNAAAWTTEPIPATEKLMAWMFAAPAQIDGRHGTDLFAGGKGANAMVGWLEAPRDPRILKEWKWHPVRSAGWIMSLLPVDMDEDGDLDLIFSDRKGTRRGCFWLEHPNDPAQLADAWTEHVIGVTNREVMFLTLADLDRDGLKDVIVATHDRHLVYLRRTARLPDSWDAHVISIPDHAGDPKAVAVGDIDQDGRLDLVFTCEGADRKQGVVWFSYRDKPTDTEWESHPLSGEDGIKYDLVELLDLDEDGDLDVLTCEERRGLGVFWYENPAK